MNILKNGIDGEFIKSGTTNIDFNSQTIRAFNNVLQTEKLLIGVGSQAVHIITERDKTIENKVTLPNRWIKGLGNVQVFLSEMELAFQLSKVEALQLFKTLPNTQTNTAYYLTKTGNGYVFSPIEKPNSIKIGGIYRLNLLQKLILSINSLLVFRHKTHQSFALILDFKDIQMTYLFSDSVYRGFSGEGRLLENLTDVISPQLIVGLNNLCKTNEVFSPTLISIENDMELALMDKLQSNLSSIGLLGYNLHNNHYFYRRLPFNLERIIGLNPRLQNAKQIIANDEIIIQENKENFVKATVKGTNDMYHTVIKQNNTYQCTCNWYTNHKNNRGMCKHILALIMVLE